MGYMHIENLYKNQDILAFKECYALEKVHGTSAHISWSQKQLTFFSGGAKYDAFRALFDADFLKSTFEANYPDENVTIYGEAYGGSLLKMANVYGNKMKFIAFDVEINGAFANVPVMAKVAARFNLDVVEFERVPTDVEVLDKLRDKPSEIAARNGMGVQLREGIVLRPLSESYHRHGDEYHRIIAKHKGEAFQERINQPKVIPGVPLDTLVDAEAIAKEWVTPMRLAHVLDKLPNARSMEHTKVVLDAMVEDVYREGKGEVVQSQQVANMIRKETAGLFKAFVNSLAKEPA
jgi:hypothetical protein